MEIEITGPDPKYVRGFNDGYLIAKNEPELSKMLKDMQDPAVYIEGFKNGVEEYTLEKDKAMQPKWLRKDRLTSFNKDVDKEIERDKDLDLDKE
jgi:hypothetical protein